VLEIRRLARQGVTKSAIARQFLVHHSLVGQIVRREIWKSV
jgi:IS30 family transposase